jgi:MtN3 and saliva related transmembrane protein
MNFGYDSLVGIAAAFLTTLSVLPQIVKAYSTRRMEDVSRYLMILFSAGSILWMIYGIRHHDLLIVGVMLLLLYLIWYFFTIVLFMFKFQ